MTNVLEVTFITVECGNPEVNATEQARELCALVSKGYEIVSTAPLGSAIYYILVLRELGEHLDG